MGVQVHGFLRLSKLIMEENYIPITVAVLFYVALLSFAAIHNIKYSKNKNDENN